MLALAYGRSSQRITCPHENAAVPSGDVNITILDDAGSEVLASTAASKGTLSTTLAAAASAGDRTITTADASGAADGEPLVIEDVEGRSELAIIDGAETTTDTIALRDRLSRAYAITTSTVKSAHIYYDLDASNTDDWPVDVYYQALFSCSTWASIRPVVFRIVDVQTLSPIGFEDVRRWLPHVSTFRDGYDAPSLDEARSSAWSVLRAKLRAAHRDPDVWRDAPDVASVGGLLAAALLLLSHNKPEQAHELAGEPIGTGGLFAAYWADFVAAPGWFDTDQDRVRDAQESIPVADTYVRRGL